jgi:hypothetical protein
MIHVMTLQKIEERWEKKGKKKEKKKKDTY